MTKKDDEPRVTEAAENGPSSQDAQKGRRAARSPSLDNRRWWIKILLQPLLFLAVGLLLIGLLALSQKLGWISVGEGTGNGTAAESAGADTLYICPMMCTPPQKEPGRCPVCGMELVPSASGAGDAGDASIEIDPVARRVANIRTTAVESVPLSKRIRTIGELAYDEGRLKTIAAYVDGRLEKLLADYTGVAVAEGDSLALLYSPQLYSAQVELLVARQNRPPSRPAGSGSIVPGGRDLYESARQRLLEFGMTSGQIEQLERSGQANSRLHIAAPISGTVIEKLAVEGQYVKTGEPIYRLADLSALWLMLELFPDDASAIRYGQKIEAVVQSQPGRKFTGRVAFVDPMVNPKTRTVGVRVVIPNDDASLRVGDYATATITVNLSGSGQPAEKIYDPELAGKWVSPRHPQVIEDEPGSCRLCGIELVPAERFGFTSVPQPADEALVVPRSAVLMAGSNSVVYLETDFGRFELRRVVLGPAMGDQIAILSGLEAGEQVAVSGNFLIDSQMQLAGKPSLIDPAKGEPAAPEQQQASPEVLAALAELPAADRALAEAQRICPVTRFPLGSMGVPPKVEVLGRTVFLCCEGCRDSLLDDPEHYLAILDEAKSSSPSQPGPGGGDLPPMGPMVIVDPEDPVSGQSPVPTVEIPPIGEMRILEEEGER